MASLSATLRERTAAAHRRVEGTSFVRTLPALAPLYHPDLPHRVALGEDLALPEEALAALGRQELLFAQLQAMR